MHGTRLIGKFTSRPDGWWRPTLTFADRLAAFTPSHDRLVNSGGTGYPDMLHIVAAFESIFYSKWHSNDWAMLMFS